MSRCGQPHPRSYPRPTLELLSGLGSSLEASQGERQSKGPGCEFLPEAPHAPCDLGQLHLSLRASVCHL